MHKKHAHFEKKYLFARICILILKIVKFGKLKQSAEFD